MKNHFKWTVIGAGPAGIAAVGQLIDHKVSPNKIAWIDPSFTVGDFGNKWRKVPSNTKVSLFIKFLQACDAFQYKQCQKNFPIHELDPDKTCELHYMVEPLQWITSQLKNQVQSEPDWVKHLKRSKNSWEIELDNQSIHSDNVILAIGAEPKTISFDIDRPLIPLEIALDPTQLSAICHKKNKIAVFGSSHSAILIIRNLLETTNVGEVINFYQSPLRYAIYLENEILFDDSGLKGTTADWARENIDGMLPKKLTRVLSTAENINQYLTKCTHAIHAVGFNKRTLSIQDMPHLHHNDSTGVIAPGLFGVGIAFPEAKQNHLGNLEYRVGLWKFMEYIKRVMPGWLS